MYIPPRSNFTLQQSEINLNLTAGNTYLFRIADYNQATGKYVFDISGCSEAIVGEAADEKRRYENAKLRVQARKDLLRKINR